MLEANFGNGVALKKIMDALKDVMDEVTLDFSASGIEFQSLDQARVYLVTVSLRADGFVKFHCNRCLSLAMKLDGMAKILKFCENDDTITLRARDGSDTASLMFSSKSGSKECDFDIKLYDVDRDVFRMPQFDYTCKIRMSALEFARICRNLSQFSDVIVISCNQDGVQFFVSGDFIKASVQLAKTHMVVNEENAVQVSVQEPLTQAFNIRYLLEFIKATPIAKQVHLSMAANEPLMVEYRISNLGEIRYFLSKRIEDE